MILEWLKSLTTPALPEAKRLGLLREAIAIEARARRCHAEWRPHLNKCMAEINTALGQMKDGGHVVVLGSGGLNDIDLNAMTAKAARIDLVDIVHLSAARRLTTNLRSVSLIEADVTGLAKTFVEWAEHGEGPLPSAQPGFSFLDGKPDLTISLNLLSQLALPFLRYQKGRWQEKVQIAEFEEHLMQNHIKALRQLPGQKLLITDIERRYFKGSTIEVDEVLMPSLKLPKPKSTWNWTIAPKSEAKSFDRIEHLVGAFDLGQDTP